MSDGPQRPGIGQGLRLVWVVLAQEHDHSGPPQLLAAYDGEYAESSAIALVELIKRAGSSLNIVHAPVPLWPLLVGD